MPAGGGHPVHEGRRHEVLRQEGPGHRGHEPQGHRRRRHRLRAGRRARRRGQTAEDAPKASGIEGRPETVSLVENIMEPVGRMDGDSLPVSAFVGYEDGTVPAGRRGLSRSAAWPSSVPEWNARHLHPVQPVRLRVPARHHPSLRADRRGAGGGPGADQACSPSRARWALTCSTCWPSRRSTAWAAAVCVIQCPTDSLTMKPIAR